MTFAILTTMIVVAQQVYGQFEVGGTIGDIGNAVKGGAQDIGNAVSKGAGDM